MPKNNTLDGILFDEPALTDEQRRLDSILDEMDADNGFALSQNLNGSVTKSPDQQAELAETADKAGVPLFVAEARPEEFRRQNRLQEINTALDDAPVTRNSMAQDESFAAVSHDDVENLAALETQWRERASMDASRMGFFEQLFKNRGERTTEILKQSGRGAKLGAMDAYQDRYLADLRANLRLRGINLSNAEMEGGFKAIEADKQNTIERFKQAEQRIAELTPDNMGWFAEGVSSGLDSLTFQAPGLVASLATGSATPMLATIGAQVSTEAYGNARAEGLTPEESIRFAAFETAIEIATEKIPADRLVDIFGTAGKGAIGELRDAAMRFAVGEGLGEQAATALQTLNAVAHGLDDELANAESPAEMAAIQGRRQLVTAVATVTAGGSQSGIAYGLGKMVEKHQNRKLSAMTDAEQISTLMSSAEASETRKRSPQKFFQLLRNMEEDIGELADVFITANEAEAWLQGQDIDTAQTEHENPAIDRILKQLPQLRESGGDVVIPAAEAITYLPELKNLDSLLVHAKTDARGYTQAEIEQSDIDIRDRVNSIVEEAQRHADVHREARVIYESIEQQLIDTGRLGEEAAGYTAQLIPAYVTTKAARTGISVRDVYEMMGLAIVGPDISVMAGETMNQETLSIQMANMEGIRSERAEVDADRESIAGQMQNINDLLTSISEGQGIDLTDDQAVSDFLSAQLFAGQINRNAVLESQPDSPSVFGRDMSQTATPEKLLEQLRGLEAVLPELQGAMDEVERRAAILDERVDVIMSGAQRTLEQGGSRGSITFTDQMKSILQLTAESDLTTTLHEFGHLFLEMEARIFNDPRTPASAKSDVQAIFDFLGVDSFDDIGTEQHEKWAETFELYLMEGKAPSVGLRNAFRRFAAWLKMIYRSLTQQNVSVSPEVRQVFDRMLASDEEISVVQDEQNYQPIFRSAEEAGMTDAEYQKYTAQQLSAIDSADEKLRVKILSALRRTTQQWWQEELESVQSRVQEELEAEPLYRAIKFMKGKKTPDGMAEHKMDRATAYEILGVGWPVDFKSSPDVVDNRVDSLSVAIAKLGGIARDEAFQQGIDPAFWRNRSENTILFGKPLFRATKGRTFDDIAEVLFEEGYLDEHSTNELLAKLDEELSGNTQYSRLFRPELAFGDIDAEYIPPPRNLRGTTKINGAHPDTVATLFGFASGAELLRQVAGAPPLTKAVVDRSNAIMIERHGDILNDGTLELEALEASHDLTRGRAIYRELQALALQTNKAAMARQMVRRNATDTIAGIQLSKLRPEYYRRAEIKAAQEAAVALAEGNQELAKEAKERQYLNFHLWRAANEAIKKAEQLRRRGRTMQTTTYSSRRVNPEFTDRFKTLLEAFDFRRSKRNGRQNAQAIVESVRAWIEKQNEASNSLAIINTAQILDNPLHYNEMTLDDLQQVMDVAESIYHAGRSDSDVERAQFNKDMEDIAANIDRNNVPKDPLDPEVNWGSSLSQWGQSAAAAHRKLESLVRQADGMQDLGPLWKRVIKPLLEANRRSVTMHNEAHDALNEIFAGHNAAFHTMQDRRPFTLESGRKIHLSLSGRMAVALNWGNEGNRTALLNMKGMKLTEADVGKIMESLDDSQWDVVEKVWKYIDSYWGQIAELEKSLKGVAPKRVTPSPFVTPSGRVMAGGYYPLISDERLGFFDHATDIKQRADRLQRGAIGQATTSHGFTEARTDFAGQNVKLSIEGLFQHVDEVIHDLSHRVAVREANRVLSHRKVKESLTKALGVEGYKAMVNRVTTVAAGHVNPSELGFAEKIFRWSRLALTYGALGFSLKSGFSQTLGITVATAELGEGAIFKGMADFYSNRAENWEFIKEKSVFMKDRVSTMNRDSGTVLRNLRGEGALTKIQEQSFIFLLAGDMVVSSGVWWSAYNVGLGRVGSDAAADSGFKTEADAIDYADRMVSRTQQSGLLMDLSGVESQNEFFKMWTVMYSAFNAIYNMTVEQTKKHKAGKISPLRLAGNISWILLMSSIWEEMLMGEAPEDEEGLEKAGRYLGAVAEYSLGTMFLLRDLGWYMSSGRASELPVQRLLKTPFDIAKQVGQGELDAAAIRSFTTLLSLAHIPGASQLNRSLDFLFEVGENNEELSNIWEFAVTGPQDDD